MATLRGHVPWLGLLHADAKLRHGRLDRNGLRSAKTQFADSHQMSSCWYPMSRRSARLMRCLTLTSRSPCGLMSSPHQHHWAQEGEDLVARIKHLLPEAAAVDHIGSTSGTAKLRPVLRTAGGADDVRMRSARGLRSPANRRPAIPATFVATMLSVGVGIPPCRHWRRRAEVEVYGQVTGPLSADPSGPGLSSGRSGGAYLTGAWRPDGSRRQPTRRRPRR